MVKLIANPIQIGKKFTVDIEVENTHSYLIATKVPVAAEASGTTEADNHNPQYKYVCSHNSVSLLAGTTPGVHYPISRYYLRRVRLMKESPLIPALLRAGLHIEDCFGSEKTTCVVTFPIKLDENVRTQSEVSVWEKVRLAEFLQNYWADNQVSVTIDFDPATESQHIKHILDYCQYTLKSVSFLPRSEGIYPQMPYEAITEEKYNELAKNIKPVVFDDDVVNRDVEKEQDIFCDGDTCTVVKR